jgi:spermidine synthase
VLVVGLGAGATPAAIAQHSGTQVDVVELSEAVVDAAPWFAATNAGALHLPNVRVTIEDGRNSLLRARQRYDVITADVVHPYDAGATNLYSVEYFRLAARALEPHGIMVQWVSPGSAFEHALLVRTFLQAFPQSTLWLAGDLLIGSPSPLQVSRAELARRLADPAARASLAEVGLLKPEDVLVQFRADADALHAYAGAGPVLTDDRPLLEYFVSLNAPTDPPDLSRFNGDPAPIITS